MLKIGWFSSGNGIGSLQLLSKVNQAILNNKLNASIEFIFTNKDPEESAGAAGFYKYGTSLNIPFINISSAKFKKKYNVGKFDEIRKMYDDEIITAIKTYRIDIIVMAGYMLFIDKNLCNKYVVINLHPAPPKGPSGTWQQIIKKLIITNSLYGGAQIQIATTNRDKGPIISYCTFPIKNNSVYANLWDKIPDKNLLQTSKLFHQIRKDTLIREPHLLIETLKSIESQQIPLHSKSCHAGICLNNKIAEVLE
jgi:phosphoribosylglycinamide formyltransferase-1